MPTQKRALRTIEPPLPKVQDDQPPPFLKAPVAEALRSGSSVEHVPGGVKVEIKPWLVGTVLGEPSMPFKGPDGKKYVSLDIELEEGRKVQISERSGDPYLSGLQPGDKVNVLALKEDRFQLLEETPEILKGVVAIVGRERQGEKGPVRSILVQTDQGERWLSANPKNLLYTSLQKGNPVEITSKIGPDANPKNFQLVSAEIQPIEARVIFPGTEYTPPLKGDVQYPTVVSALLQFNSGTQFLREEPGSEAARLLENLQRGQVVYLVPDPKGARYEILPDYVPEKRTQQILKRTTQQPESLPQPTPAVVAGALTDHQSARPSSQVQKLETSVTGALDEVTPETSSAPDYRQEVSGPSVTDQRVNESESVADPAAALQAAQTVTSFLDYLGSDKYDGQDYTLTREVGGSEQTTAVVNVKDGRGEILRVQSSESHTGTSVLVDKLQPKDIKHFEAGQTWLDEVLSANQFERTKGSGNIELV